MIPREAADLLSNLELDTKMSDNERADILAKAGELINQTGESGKLQEVKWDFLFFRLMLTQEPQRFSPMVTYTNGSVFPDTKTFTNQQVDYYKKRADETKNPIYKARYSDFLWVSRHDYVYAKAAIKAYLECTKIYNENNGYLELIDALQRATDLSMTLNDAIAIDQVSLCLIDWIQVFSTSNNLRWCLEPIECLIRMKRILKSKELEQCIIVAEAGAQYYKKINDGFHLQRSFLKLLVKLSNILKKTEQSLAYAYEIAESYEKEGDWKLTNYPSGDLVAAHFYEQAAVNYRELGEREKTSDLLKKIKEHMEKAEESFHEISLPFTISTEPIEKYAEKLLLHKISEALSVLSKEDFFVPNVQSIRIRVNGLKGKSVSLAIPILSIRDSNPVLRSRSEDEIIEDRIINEIAMDYKVKSSLFGLVIDKLAQKKDLNADVLVTYLTSYQAFEKSSPELLRIGFERFFKEDYVSCIHILVPQLEKAFRTCLYKLGVSTTVMGKESVQEKQLGAILRETRMNLLLGQSVHYYIKTLLEDKRGDNLRNDLSHGLITFDICSRNTANTILHIYLIHTRFNFNYGICSGITVNDSKALE